MRYSIGAFLIFLLVACDRGPYPGFKKADDGIWFQLRMLGEGSTAPMTGDSVLLRIRMAMSGHAPGSLFSSERYFEVDRARVFDEAILARMNEGDSISVIVAKGRFPWAQWIGVSIPPPADTAMLHAEIALIGIMDGLEIQERLTEARQPAGTAITEQLLLMPYADSTDWSRWGTSDLFYRITDQGTDTAAIRTGQMVSLKLLGSFMDGRVFDQGSAVQPITFVLGDPGQVINGVEVAAHLLHTGGTGEFIIPSVMAYGAKGSTSGIVPSWTPVRYVVEVVSVDDATGQVH